MKKSMMHVNAAVHDPSIFIDKDGMNYIFGSHMTAAYSKDLKDWTMFADEKEPDMPMFDNIFDKEAGVFDFAGRYADGEYQVWTPDVTYNENRGKYVMYFAVTGMAGDGVRTRSAICMAASDNVRGPYHFEDFILFSGFDKESADKTNLREVLGDEIDIGKYLDENGSYDYLRFPNCLDPNTFRDKNNELWLVYGSQSGGIFVLQLDDATGKPKKIADDENNQIDKYYGRRILGGGDKFIEGAFIIYDKVADYYYLFASFGDKLTQGHQIRLFRAKKPDGPFVDMSGKACRNVRTTNPYGLKLVGSYKFPSMDMAYWSPGHNSCFIDEDNNIYMVYHQRFEGRSSEHEPRVHQLFRTGNNWLSMCPFATDGEMLINKTYHESELWGTYYMVEHGLDISDEIHKALKVEFSGGGDILRFVNQSEESSDRLKEIPAYGGYLIRHGGKVIIAIDGREYECAIVQLNDEAGNPTMCITGCCDNRSLWAVKYL